MKEIIGVWFVMTAFVLAVVSLLGFELTLDEQIKLAISLELVLSLILIGARLLC